ncbi:MAG: tetratricopeptide repeat protein [Gammaproteobacteria bacterium]|nr:tetratricopeptide repeat protein [Gammaproteobacteria bacterium]
MAGCNGTQASARGRRLALLGPALLAAMLLLAGCAQFQRSDQAPGGAALPKTAPEALEAGDTALAGGDLDKALFYYLQAARLDPGSAATFTRIGNLHEARGDRQRAALAYRQALRADERHAGALAGLGILLTRQRQYAEAEAKLLAAVGEDPSLTRAHNALGVLNDLQRDYPSAKRHYEQALALAPRSPMLHNNFGYSRYLAGDDAGAIAGFEKALELNPDYSLAWRNLALVYARQGRYREALHAFGKVQDKAEAYNDVGYIAMVSGRLDDAESFFDQALRLSPKHYELASDNVERVRALRGDR